MANALYTAAKQAILDNTLDLHDGDIRAIPIDAAQYTVNLATHDNLDDIPSGARSATAVALANKAVTSGVFDADDVTFSAVTNGKLIDAIVLYLHTGTESTSKLLAYLPTATGLPLTASGADVTVTWDNGANKILAL
jgi:hypothetical protein